MNFLEDLKSIQRSPRMIMGITLILISFLAAIAITESVGQRETFYEVSHELVAGEQIAATDLHKVSLVQAGMPLEYSLNINQILGHYAEKSISTGELLNKNLVSEFAPKNLEKSIPIEVNKNNISTNIQVGDYVDIYEFPASVNVNKSQEGNLIFSHVDVLEVNNMNSTYGNQVGISIGSRVPNLTPLLSMLNGANVVVVKDNE